MTIRPTSFSFSDMVGVVHLSMFQLRLFDSEGECALVASVADP